MQISSKSTFIYNNVDLEKKSIDFSVIFMFSHPIRQIFIAGGMIKVGTSYLPMKNQQLR
jgi:hypothetical protein